MSKFKLPKINLKNLKKLDRNIILAGSLVTILIVVGIFAIIFRKNTESPAISTGTEQVNEIQTAQSLDAHVSYTEGIVEYKTDGMWANAPEDLDILPGMYVKTTGAASKAIIKLADGSEVRLDANSEVKFETLTVERVVVAQSSGYVYNRIVKTENRTYVVSLPNAQIQSEGTAFRTSNSGDEEAVEVFQSSIKDTTSNVTAQEGEKLTIKSATDSSKNMKVEKLDIEKLKDDNFITWNREQDSKNNTFKNSLGFLSDIEGPTIALTNPSSGSTVDVESDVKNPSVVLTGKTEPNASLTVQSKSISGAKVLDVTVEDDGTFTTPSLDGTIGNSVFSFIAKDKTGNTTEYNATINFRRKTASSQTQGLSLSASLSADSSMINLTWTLSGITTPNGVKLLSSDNDTDDITYPSHLLEWIQTGTTKQLNTSSYPSGSTQYFKVCRYIQTTTIDTCDIYSNKVSVVIP